MLASFCTLLRLSLPCPRVMPIKVLNLHRHALYRLYGCHDTRFGNIFYRIFDKGIVVLQVIYDRRFGIIFSLLKLIEQLTSERLVSVKLIVNAPLWSNTSISWPHSIFALPVRGFIIEFIIFLIFLYFFSIKESDFVHTIMYSLKMLLLVGEKVASHLFSSCVFLHIVITWAQLKE